MQVVPLNPPGRGELPDNIPQARDRTGVYFGIIIYGVSTVSERLGDSPPKCRLLHGALTLTFVQGSGLMYKVSPSMFLVESPVPFISAAIGVPENAEAVSRSVLVTIK